MPTKNGSKDRHQEYRFPYSEFVASQIGPPRGADRKAACDKCGNRSPPGYIHLSALVLGAEGSYDSVPSLVFGDFDRSRGLLSRVLFPGSQPAVHSHARAREAALGSLSSYEDLYSCLLDVTQPVCDGSCYFVPLVSQQLFE